MYSSSIIRDSVGPNGIRLTTFLLRYPRCVLPEMLTHSSFSRNTKSSRAVPISRYIKEVINDPYVPVYWGRAKRGMQAGEEIKSIKLARIVWFTALYFSVMFAWILYKLGLHKQVVNRLLEPFLFVDQIVTADQFALSNFFNLRCGLDGAADPSMQKIARMMARIYGRSKPLILNESEWHLPFIDDVDIGENPDWNLLCKISAARCARLSYYTFGTCKRSTKDENLKLFEKLVGGNSKHCSICAHQAQAMNQEYAILPSNPNRVEISGNLFGWRNFRKTIPGEFLAEFKGEIDDKEFSIF